MNEALKQIIRKKAEERTALHVSHSSQRQLSDDYNYVGLMGEFAFGMFCGKMPDVEERPAGDKGQDFELELTFSVDVKTARNAAYLIQEFGKVVADIYVLAEYDELEDNITLIGWHWGKVLAKAPVKDFGYGIDNHYIPKDKLKPGHCMGLIFYSWRKLIVRVQVLAE